MALFDGDVLYNNVKGSLKIMVDGATFVAETSGAVLDLQFLPEPTSRPIAVWRKAKRVVFTVDGQEHSFTILEVELDGKVFEKCLAAVKKLVDPEIVAELRDAARGPSSGASSPASASQYITSSVSSQGSQATSQVSDTSPRSSSIPQNGFSSVPVSSFVAQSPPNLSSISSSTNSNPQTRSTGSLHRRSDYFLFVEVKEPQVETETATYLVAHRTNMPEYSILEGEVRRRYSQFEGLHAALKGRFSKLSSVPELPGKAWFRKFDKSFLEQRTRELNTWLKAIAMDEYMYKSTELVHFLTDQAPIPQSAPGGYVDALIRPFVDNQVVVNIGDTINGTVANVLSRAGASSSSNASNPAQLVGSPLERDYHTARALMEQWKLTPKKLPFPGK